MDDGKTLLPSLRQLLWIAAGVVVLTALVLAGSWLFSPRSPEGSGAPGSARLPEEQVRKETFTPESARPGSEAPQPAPQPPRAEAQAGVPASAPPPVASSAEPAQTPTEETAGTPETPSKAPAPAPESAGTFGVQVGAFSTRDKAEELRHRLAEGGFDASVTRKGGLFKVIVASYRDRSEAEKGVAALKRAGYASAFVVRME